MDQKAQKNYRGTSKSERPKWVECFKIERILGGALKRVFYSGGIIFLQPPPQIHYEIILLGNSSANSVFPGNRILRMFEN